ncbi:MAG: thioesterase [Bacteroidetes bacterium RIFCSPLOWO2_12_FULL_31_6]|nr:MAG: thioesterase [Bacteroidetes bacterium RIFCSPLOWO2_12_FULL_31_6]
MHTSEIALRVRYSETDRIGFVYYGNYAQYFEVARVETLRSLGISYKEMEDNGIFLPVLEYNIQYLKPGKYDDELIIKTSIMEMPQARIRFEYEVINDTKIVIAKAYTVLAFLNKDHKPIRCPENILEKLKKYF